MYHGQNKLIFNEMRWGWWGPFCTRPSRWVRFL